MTVGVVPRNAPQPGKSIESPKPAAAFEARWLQPGLQCRALLRGDILFAAGEPRTAFFRVETGAVCIHEPVWMAGCRVLECAVPGDLVGLGYRATHTFGARALIDTHVTCFPAAALDQLVLADVALRDRLRQAIAAEFDFVRSALVKANEQNAVGRLAALLVVVARNNAYEGHDPTLVSDKLSCGMVGSCLGLGIDELQHALVELERRGMIETCPDSALRLKDLPALERLSGSTEEALAPPPHLDQQHTRH